MNCSIIRNVKYQYEKEEMLIWNDGALVHFNDLTLYSIPTHTHMSTYILTHSIRHEEHKYRTSSHLYTPTCSRWGGGVHSNPHTYTLKSIYVHTHLFTHNITYTHTIHKYTQVHTYTQ